MVADELILDEGEWSMERAEAALDEVLRPEDAKAKAVLVRLSEMALSSACEVFFPGLTGRQNIFLREFLCNGGVAAQAYRLAYDTRNANEGTVRNAACRLLSNKKIKAALALVRKEAVKSLSCGLEDHLRELAVLRDMAKSSGDIKAAIAAEVARGKAAGLYVERTQQMPPAMSAPPQLTPAEFAAIAAVVAAEY